MLGAVLAARNLRIVERQASRGVLIPSYRRLVLRVRRDRSGDRRLASADSRAEQPALTSGRTTLGYAELARRIRSTAIGAAAEGLQPGDRVLFSVRPGPQAVILALVDRARRRRSWSSPIREQARRSSAQRARLAAPRWVAAESLLYWPPARHCADSPGGADWSSRRMPGSYRRPAIFGRAAGCPVHLSRRARVTHWPAPA